MAVVDALKKAHDSKSNVTFLDTVVITKHLAGHNVMTAYMCGASLGNGRKCMKGVRVGHACSDGHSLSNQVQGDMKKVRYEFKVLIKSALDDSKTPLRVCIVLFDNVIKRDFMAGLEAKNFVLMPLAERQQLAASFVDDSFPYDMVATVNPSGRFKVHIMSSSSIDHEKVESFMLQD